MMAIDIPKGFITGPLRRSTRWMLSSCCLLFRSSKLWTIRWNSASTFVLLNTIHLELIDINNEIIRIWICLPRKNCNDWRASSCRPWVTSQIGVSGRKIIPTRSKRGKELRIQAKMCQSTNAPMTYVTTMPKDKEVAVTLPITPRILGAEHSVICNRINCSFVFLNYKSIIWIAIKTFDYVNLWGWCCCSSC